MHLWRSAVRRSPANAIDLFSGDGVTICLDIVILRKNKSQFRFLLGITLISGDNEVG